MDPPKDMESSQSKTTKEKIQAGFQGVGFIIIFDIGFRWIDTLLKNPSFLKNFRYQLYIYISIEWTLKKIIIDIRYIRGKKDANEEIVKI